MTVTYKSLAWTRTHWQGVRDGYNVPKGAARVSVGDALDKYHKNRLKSPEAGIAAANELLKTLDAYQTALKKAKPKHTGAKEEKYKELDARIARILYINVQQDRKVYNDMIARAKSYSAHHAAASRELQQAAGEFINWKKRAEHEEQEAEEEEGTSGSGERTFTPSNARKAKVAFGVLVDDLQTLEAMGGKITEQHYKALNGAVRQLAGDNWYEGAINSLIRVMTKDLPASL
ncbi:MAG TPA: hypothetical protein VKB75_13175 [Jatrophihabitans sp.]|nr:hypothetical protein [Jatrophihabitans sp.]